MFGEDATSTGAHESILTIARTSDGVTRLVTTHYDRHFEDAAKTSACTAKARAAYRHWEVAADVLQDSGDVERAVEFLELARARVDPHFDGRLARLVGTQADRDALARERKAETERLAKRLTAMRQKQP